MRAALNLCLALLLIALSGTASARPQQPSSTKLHPSERALTLAKILNSDANVIGSDQDDERMLALVPELFGSKEHLAKLEAEYPGLSVELMRAVLPTINRHSRARLTTLWQRQAALYDKALTAEDIDQLVAFYGSPTGQKMVAAMFRHIKPTAMLADAKKSDEFAVSSGAALTDIQRTVPGVMSEMDAADQARLVDTFSRPGLALKMKELAPKTQAVTIEWMSESAPGEEDEIDKIMTSVIERRLKNGGRK